MGCIQYGVGALHLYMVNTVIINNTVYIKKKRKQNSLVNYHKPCSYFMAFVQ